MSLKTRAAVLLLAAAVFSCSMCFWTAAHPVGDEAARVLSAPVPSIGISYDVTGPHLIYDERAAAAAVDKANALIWEHERAMKLWIFATLVFAGAGAVLFLVGGRSSDAR